MSVHVLQTHILPREDALEQNVAHFIHHHCFPDCLRNYKYLFFFSNLSLRLSFTRLRAIAILSSAAEIPGLLVGLSKSFSTFLFSTKNHISLHDCFCSTYTCQWDGLLQGSVCKIVNLVCLTYLVQCANTSHNQELKIASFPQSSFRTEELVLIF